MYVISDVHGCIKTLKALVSKLPLDEIIYFTGDLIDRGPNSKEVIQWLIDNSSRCKSVIGNHEQMLLNVHDNPNMSNTSNWSWNGGELTLDSYFPETIRGSSLEKTDLDKLKSLMKERRNVAIPQDHLDFIYGLPLYIEDGSLFVSHSSWNPEIPFDNVLELEDSQGYYEGLTWHRGTPGRLPDNRFHIFGHTPVKKPIITDYFANIDTACVYGGKLTAIHYPSLEIYQSENIDSSR